MRAQNLDIDALFGIVEVVIKGVEKPSFKDLIEN